MSCVCQKCGRKYKVDFNVPDRIWMLIKPKDNNEGLLCGSCIINGIEKINNYAVFEIKEL